MTYVDRRSIARHADPEIALQERVEELDGGWAGPWERRRRIQDPREHFLDVMSSWTDASAEERVDPKAAIAAGAADSIVASSVLLKEIAVADRGLVRGPMDRDRQQWTPTGPAALTGEAPSRSRFVEPDAARTARVKPSRFGMFSSTAAATGPSMWRVLLGSGGSQKLPLDRYTWALDIDHDARIAEIVTASDWVTLVRAHPCIEGDRLVPNWADVARQFDGVHFTLSVIAAIQAFPIRAGELIIPATYWDVETTLWLSWRFSGVQLLESRGTATAT
jgi:hypothetical protein